LPTGKKFIIRAKNNSSTNKYIQSEKWNGAVWDNPWFSHSDIKDGGVLELTMGDEPNKLWGNNSTIYSKYTLSEVNTKN
jgi:putative alpha-1,2-mannosidase